MAEEFLDEIGEFIDKLINVQKEENENLYKTDKDFSVQLNYFMQESSFLVEQLSLAYQMKAPPAKQGNSVDLKLIDKAKGQEHEGFELTENQTIRMSNHLSPSTFASVSHRLRSMVLTPGDVFSCYGRLKVRIASQQGDEDS